MPVTYTKHSNMICRYQILKTYKNNKNQHFLNLMVYHRSRASPNVQSSAISACILIIRINWPQKKILSADWHIIWETKLYERMNRAKFSAIGSTAQAQSYYLEEEEKTANKSILYFQWDMMQD